MAIKPTKPAKPTAFKPVKGSSVKIKLDEPKPYRPNRPSAPLTPGKLARSPEADDVLITTRKSPDIVRTTVRERTTPSKLVQVSPKEFRRREPGETVGDVKKRVAQETAKIAADRARGERNLQVSRALDRMVGAGKRTTPAKKGK